MSGDTHSTTLTADGCTLARCEYGDPAAPAVSLFRGTHGPRLDRDPFVALVAFGALVEHTAD
jgi:hypothetical protein